MPVPALPTVRLSKYHGLGNDFLVLIVAAGAHAPTDEEHMALAVASCDRHLGIGADGLLVCSLDAEGDADLRMKLRNADGSLAEMSGNGIRCFVHAAIDAGLVAPGPISVATDGGLRRLIAQPPAGGVVQVEVAMGEVHLNAVVIPDSVKAIIGDRQATTVNVGNPHIVINAHPATVDLTTFGPAVEAFYLTTEFRGINVEVVAPSPTHPDTIDMAVWERGVGITQACGTGAVAAAAVAHSWAMVGNSSTVRQPGGDAIVVLQEHEATLIGPSQFVCAADFAWTGFAGGDR
jgi:diaminopimelate epimerase